MKTFHSPIKRLVLIILSCVCSISPFAQGFSPVAAEKLQHVLDSFQNNTDTPFIGGISAAINVDGLAVWKGASGFAARNIDENNNLLPGGTPFITDTLSRMYSITKTFTAALTLDLANEGVFSLSSPIIMYLPLLSAYNPELNTSVTIHQLLAHESGYSDYTDEPDFQVALAYQPTHIWTPYEITAYVHQEAAPGAVRKYSSTNYALLGAIIEAATGTPVEQLFRKRYFDKLGLSSLYLAGRESIGNRGYLAAPHDNISPFNPIFSVTGQPLFPDTSTNISRFPFDGVVSAAFTGGAMAGNATDVSKWGNALFGGRATHEATIDSMTHSISPYPDEDGDYLGYGVFSNHKISETDSFIGHNGNALGYRAIMFYQPDRKMTIAVLINFHGIDPYSIGRELYKVLPDFLCGAKDHRVSLCYKGYSLCLPRTVAPFLLKRGAYLSSCGQPLLLNTDSLLLADLSPSELTAAGISKLDNAKDELRVYPNPIQKQASLSFRAGHPGLASLRIVDINGKPVKQLFSGQMNKGELRTATLNATALPAGIYIAILQTSAGSTRQMLVINHQ